MEAKRQKGRRWLRAVAALVVLGLVVALAFPLWAPAALRFGLRMAGVGSAAATREGVGGVVFSGVSYAFSGGSFEVQTLRVPSLGRLVAFYAWGGGSGGGPMAEVRGWRVRIEPDPAPSAEPARATPGVGEVLDQVEVSLEAVKRWVPPVAIGPGRVSIRERSILCANTVWREGVLVSTLGLESSTLEVRVELHAARGGRWDLTMETEEPPVTAKLHGSRAASGWTVDGEGKAWGQGWEIRSEFSVRNASVWPTSLTLNVREGSDLAAVGFLAGLEQAAAEVVGVGDGEGLDVRLSCRARHPQQVLGGMEALMSGRVDGRGVRVDRGTVRAAPGTISLGEPLAWEWGEPWGGRSLHWLIRADLAQQPWVPVKGELEGQLESVFTPGGPVRLKGGFQGLGVSGWGVDCSTVELRAEALGPLLQQASMRLETTNASVLMLGVQGWQILTGEVGGVDLRAELQPAEVPGLHEAFEFDSATLTLTGSGRLDALAHHGGVDVKGWRMPGVRRSDVVLDWEGEGWRAMALGLGWQTGQGSLRAEGELLDLSKVRLTGLSLNREGAGALQLGGPAEVGWERDGPEGGVGARGVAVRFGKVILSNADQRIDLQGEVHWPERGSFELKAEALDLGWGEVLLERPLPRVAIEQLRLKGGWDRGPVVCELDGSGTIVDEQIGALRSVARLRTDAAGLRVDRLELLDGERLWATLSGQVPMVFQVPPLGSWVELRGEGAMRVEAELEPSALLERWLERAAGLRLLGADAVLRLGGTPLAPEGEVSVKIGSVARASREASGMLLPALGPIDLAASVRPDRIELKTLRLEVGGHPLVGRGELPLAEGVWAGLLEGRWQLDASPSTAELEFKDFPLSALGAGVLGVLRPEGEIGGKVRLRPGWQWEGELEVSGVATRAFPLVGPVRRIEGRIVVEDQQATLSGLEADLGGELVRLSGVVDTSPCWRRPAQWPTFDLTLQGKGLPLARQAGLIVRSDLDLNLVRNEGESTWVRGEVQVQRSFVLSDLEAALGTGVRRVMRSPPYFSVEQEPLASWRLDLAIRGDRCIHVKSPFYRGVHSVNLRLGGTMRDPVLSGDVRVDEGRVVFPYAALPVRQGIVTFSEQDPEEPRLVLMGGARTFGYDLRMEAGGTLREPSVQFSSTPSLTSEEIVMMITAGELPRNELSTTTQDRLAKLATLVGKDILNKLGSQDAGEERLIIRSGEGISTTGRVTHYLEYRLSDQWGLVGEYDEYDAINAGVKWRIIRR